MTTTVQCYAGHKADERPIRFQTGGRDYMVEEIVEQWCGPDGAYYKVRADDHGIYLLGHRTSTDTWESSSVQKPPIG